MNIRTSILSALASIVLTCACAVHPVTLQQEFNIVSESKELSIGRRAHPQIIKEFGYYHNPVLQRYVDGIGQKLAAVCRRRDISYHFTILDSDMVNAFAVPGGYVYVTRGLLAYLNNEAELAGVLGHEIGHIVGRDSAIMMSQSMIAQIAVLAGVAGAAAASGGADVAIATQQLFQSLMLGFSRDREFLADEQSVEYVRAAGYDPLQMNSFMRTLSHMGQGPTGPQQYLMTHPYIFDRIDRIQAKCKVMDVMHTTMYQLHNHAQPAAVRSSGTINSREYLQLLDGLAFGPKNNIRHLKLYRVLPGDSFATIARRTLGSSVRAPQLAILNGLPTEAPLVPGATVKVLY